MSRELLWLVVALLSIAALARGDEMQRAPLPAVSDQIADLIEALDDPAFATRQEASEQLEAAGAAAIAELETTAGAGSREAMTRAFAILKKHFQADDAELKSAAGDALARLAEHREPSLAQRARDIIHPPRPVVATNRFPAPAAPRAPRPAMNININNFRRVTVSDINGRKSVEIDDRERKVKIEARPGGNIEVEVTDKLNLAAGVRRIVAKDAAELAKTDPEIGRLHEQHLGGRAQAAGGVPPLAPRNGRAGQIAIEPADASRLQLQTVDALLNRFRQRAQTDPAAQRMVDSLEQMRSRLKAVAR